MCCFTFQLGSPLETDKSVPYGLLRRCRRICSEERYFEDEAQDILKKLVAWKFQTDLLRETHNKVSKVNRLKLLSTTQKQETTKIRLVNPYNPRSQNFNHILCKYKGLLLMTRKEATKPEDIQVTYSRYANPRDMLIIGSLQGNQIPRVSQPCGRPRCKTCPHVK